MDIVVFWQSVRGILMQLYQNLIKKKMFIIKKISEFDASEQPLFLCH